MSVSSEFISFCYFSYCYSFDASGWWGVFKMPSEPFDMYDKDFVNDVKNWPRAFVRAKENTLTQSLFFKIESRFTGGGKYEVKRFEHDTGENVSVVEDSYNGETIDVTTNVSDVFLRPTSLVFNHNTVINDSQYVEGMTDINSWFPFWMLVKPKVVVNNGDSMSDDSISSSGSLDVTITHSMKYSYVLKNASNGSIIRSGSGIIGDVRVTASLSSGTYELVINFDEVDVNDIFGVNEARKITITV